MNDNLVLVSTDADTGALYESWSGGYPVPRATWEEYQRKPGELDAFAARLMSGEYVAGWRFRGEPKPEPTSLSEFMMYLVPVDRPPLRNPLPRGRPRALP